MQSYRTWILIWTLSTFYSIITLIRISFSLISNGWQALEVKDRPKPPILTDPKLGKHKHVVLETRGLKLHYVENGNSNKPLLILIHGFPECWLMWRNQLKDLADQFRVVAVDQPGYGDSDNLPRKHDYRLENLVECMKEFCSALGVTSDNKCCLIGHDHGGVLCWLMVEKYPELFHHHVNINSYHPYIKNKVIGSSIIQFCKSWYVFLCQMPIVPEMLLNLNDHHLLANLKGIEKDSIEGYKYYFSKKGYTGPLNFYRCMFYFNDVEPKEKFKVPTLILWGENDDYISFKVPLNILPYCEQVQLQKIKNCYHFAPENKPEIVTEAIRTYLKSA